MALAFPNGLVHRNIGGCVNSSNDLARPTLFENLANFGPVTLECTVEYTPSSFSSGVSVATLASRHYCQELRHISTHFVGHYSVLSLLFAKGNTAMPGRLHAMLIITPVHEYMLLYKPLT